MKPNGYILHEDAHRVVIATGFARPSANRKTGPMIQIWILTRDTDPVAAVATGKDRLICGNCPLRGIKGKDRACYVNLGQAPLGVWRACRAGKYPKLTDVNVFLHHTVRFGAYGDPTHIPLPLAKQIAVVSNGWTGYTHQWRKPAFQPWRTLIMASVESAYDAAQAQAMGWRTFQVVAKDHPTLGDSIPCPSATGTQCKDCRLCQGTAVPARSIHIAAHGSGAKYVAEN